MWDRGEREKEMKGEAEGRPEPGPWSRENSSVFTLKETIV